MSTDAGSGGNGGRLSRYLKWGALAQGVVGAAWTAATVKTVRSELSRAREPLRWKPPAGSSVLLKGVDVVDVKAGRVLHGRGLLFEDGRITRVVPARDLEKVEAGRLFDCSGLVAIPGLINCHCHSLMPGALGTDLDLGLSLKRQGLRNLEECAIRGVTTVRDASSLGLLIGRVAGRTEGFELLGPRIFQAGSGLMAKGGYPDFSYPLPGFLARRYGQFAITITNPEEGREAVRTVIEQGARFVKLFFDDQSLFFGHKKLNVPSDETVLAVIDEAHKAGRRVTAHQSQIQGFRRCVRLGLDDLEHMPVDGLLTDEDVKAFMDGGHNITPTFSVGMCLGVARRDHPARRSRNVEELQVERKYVQEVLSPSAAEPAVVKANARMQHVLESAREGKRPRGPFLCDPEPFLTGIGEKNIMKLYEAGAKFCCGNDGGVPLTWPGTLSVEMAIMERVGVSRADVLRSATINAAGLLGMEGELGSLEEGKLADIVLLGGNPLDDIRAVERVEAVFRSGVLLHHGVRFHLESEVGAPARSG